MGCSGQLVSWGSLQNNDRFRASHWLGWSTIFRHNLEIHRVILSMLLMREALWNRFAHLQTKLTLQSTSSKGNSKRISSMICSKPWSSKCSKKSKLSLLIITAICLNSCRFYWQRDKKMWPKSLERWISKKFLNVAEPTPLEFLIKKISS